MCCVQMSQVQSWTKFCEQSHKIKKIVNNIVRIKYIFVENNKIEILFSNYIFGLTFQNPSLKMDFGK